LEAVMQKRGEMNWIDGFVGVQKWPYWLCPTSYYLCQCTQIEAVCCTVLFCFLQFFFTSIYSWLLACHQTSQ
jgi:hypothetical protein